MSLLKRYSIKVSVGGEGANKSESQVVVPAASGKELKTEFFRYFSFSPFFLPILIDSGAALCYGKSRKRSI